MKEMKHMFENFKFNIFVKYFLILISFLLIPFFALGTVLTNYVMTQYKNEIYDMAQNSVEYISTMVEDEMIEIAKVQALMKQDSAVKTFVSQPASNIRGDKVYKAYEAIKAMEDYRAYRTIIAELHLYSELQDAVIDPSGICTREEYFEKYLVESGMEYEEWCDAISRADSSISPIIYNMPAKGKAMAIMSVLQHGNGKDSAIFAILDVGRILEIYTQVTDEMPKMYFAMVLGDHILVESGEIPEALSAEMVIGSENREELGHDYVVFKSMAPKSGLCYLCVASESIILEKVAKVEYILRGFMVVFAFVVVVLAYLFSNKTFGPVKEMMLLSFSDDTYKTSGLKEMQDLFVNVFNSNVKLREMVSNQEKCINNNMFRMFIQNSMEMDIHSLQIIFRAMPISLDSKYFRVAIMDLQEQKDCTEEILNFKILTKLQSKSEEKEVSYCVIPNDVNRNIFLFVYDKQGTDIRVILEKVTDDLKKNENIQPSVAIGREICTLNDFSKSYEDAVFALIGSKNGHSCCAYNEKNSDNFDFIEREKLISYVLAGNIERLKILFEVFHSIMFEGYLMTYRAQNYFRYSLFEILGEIAKTRTGQNYKFEKLVDKCKIALETSDYEDSFRIIRQCFLDSASEMIDQTHGKKKGFEDVIRYISENYTRDDISLKMVAEEMDISYKYLSDAFKKETGKTFLEYLHALRDNRAKELLVTTDASVAQIGEEVGYLSSNTFIKIFKKNNGITPGEYRNNAKS